MASKLAHVQGPAAHLGEPVQELCQPHQEASLQALVQGLGVGGWDLGAQEEGTYGCQGHRQVHDLPLCWDQGSGFLMPGSRQIAF